MESRPKAPSRGAASSSTVGFMDLAATDPASLVLEDGDRVCVLGGGPAGSFFTHFFQQMARRVGLQVEIDIYERKDFGANGPPGCNHCGGIVSESLVQLLAADGINLPPNVVRRGIGSYVLHTDAGMVRIETPSRERRIAAMFRGGGPRGCASADWASFDAFLLDLAREAGARVIQEYVKTLDNQDGRPVVVTRDGERRAYDLLVGATGVNALSGKLYEGLGIDYGPPGLTRTYICEYHLGEETVRERFGDAMHVFLLNIPRLKFAALVPKGDHVTMCMLGRDIDRDLVGEFLAAAEVAACFPEGFDVSGGAVCMCSPKINIGGTKQPFADRVVMLGDSAVTRLYKDGIGAAYMTAKVAAGTAVLQGISEEAFEEHYWPTCRHISGDNAIGRSIFIFTQLIQRWRFTKRGILRMVRNEQGRQGASRRMSEVLWDTFTGSATYGDIARRSISPAFLGGLAWNTLVSLPGRRERT